MKEERMAILQMVAEKKITAEEAAQLLEALGASGHQTEQSQTWTDQDEDRHTRRRRRRRPRSQRHQAGWQDALNDLSENLSSIFGDIGGMFGGQGDFPFGEQAPQEQTLDVKAGAEINVNHMAGKLIARGCDEDQLRIRVRGLPVKSPQAMVNDEGDEININALGQRMELDIPRQVGALKLNTAGGGMKLEDIRADCDLQVAGGTIKGHALNGAHNISVSGGAVHLDDLLSSDLKVKVQGGSLKIGMARFTEGYIDIQTHGGHSALSLPADANCTIDVVMERGRIDSNISGERQKENHKSTFHAVCGNGEATVRIEAHRGLVEVNIDDRP